MATVKRFRWLLIITALGAALRLATLTAESLWYDETFTAWLATLSLPRLLAAAMGDVHPPTWYIIEWAMTRLFGPTPLALRLVSALAGIALIPAVYRLARAFDYPERTALQAAALTAVAPFMVYYSQEARAYSLIYLLTTLATIGLLERRWWLLTAGAVGALYLHNLSVFYLAALGWLALWNLRLTIEDLGLGLPFLAIFLLWLPWVVLGLVPQSADVLNGFWVRAPTLGTPAFILTAWLFSGKALLFVLVTAPIMVLALAAVSWGRREWQLAGLILLTIAPAVIVSLLVKPVLVERVIGSAAIPLYLLIAPALIPAEWPRPWLTWWTTIQRYALPVMFAAVTLAYYPTLYLTDRIGRYPWNYNLSPVTTDLRPDDGLFHANLATYITLKYYLPVDQWVWLQANDLSQSLTTPTKLAMGMQQAQFEEVACLHPRWWLAFYENPTTVDAERAEIARLVEKYHGELTAVILKNTLVNARVYRIDNPCQISLRRK